MTSEEIHSHKRPKRTWSYERLSHAALIIYDLWRDKNSITDQMVSMELGLDFEQMEHQRYGGPSTIYPTDVGIYILSVIQTYILIPVSIIQQCVCEHANFVDESYGGPDSGCSAGYCEDCGWGFHVTMY